jgi:hypothetical protein
VRRLLLFPASLILVAALLGTACGSDSFSEPNQPLSARQAGPPTDLPNLGLNVTYDHQESSASFTLETRNSTSEPGAVQCTLTIDGASITTRAEPSHIEPESEVTLLISSELPPNLPLKVLEDLEPACQLFPSK